MGEAIEPGGGGGADPAAGTRVGALAALSLTFVELLYENAQKLDTSIVQGRARRFSGCIPPLPSPCENLRQSARHCSPRKSSISVHRLYEKSARAMLASIIR